MVSSRSHPWLLSLGLHLLLGGLLLTLLVTGQKTQPSAIRMRLVQGGGASPTAAVATPTWWSGATAAAATPTEPPLPTWQSTTTSPAAETAVPAVPVLLEELLGTPAPPPVSEPSARAGWTNAEGEGYAPPPLPPPGLAPPQGARWSLLLTIPGGGGFATGMEGLDSGHPDLDRWLEGYLRTVAFPSSPDGLEYQLRWSLRLDSGRPR